ncbi:uncharacterized protein Dvir_GJ26872, partial [Drosophila virilis]
MPPLQGRRQLITRLARVHRVNVNIGSYINRNATKTKTTDIKTTKATTHQIRTRDRFRFRSSTDQRQRSTDEGHLHLRGAGLAAVEVATAAAASRAVNGTCQAEELHIASNRRLAGSHKTVHRGNDAGISFAALDFRFIRNAAQMNANQPLSLEPTVAAVNLTIIKTPLNKTLLKKCN